MLPHGFLLPQLAFLDVFVPRSDASAEVVEQDHMHRLVQLEREHVGNVKKILEAKVDKLQWQQRKKP